ncbi:hypothetical protein PT2222_70020 [Paraburkholderia tropica]
MRALAAGASFVARRCARFLFNSDTVLFLFRLQAAHHGTPG